MLNPSKDPTRPRPLPELCCPPLRRDALLPKVHGARGYGSRAAHTCRPHLPPAPEGRTDDTGGMAEDLQCSSRGCRRNASALVVWNNPKVHTPDREKIWLACDEHRQSLADYLDVRGFLKRVDPLESTEPPPTEAP